MSKNYADVTAVIVTRDRYTTTLPLCLCAVINQTLPPQQLIIVDDGEGKDLRSDPVYQKIFQMAQDKGISWRVVFGQRKGLANGHKIAWHETKTEWIWRVDDDDVPESTVLKTLHWHNSSKVGAVAGLALIPGQVMTRSAAASSKIEDIYTKLNLQLFRWEGLPEYVEHFHNTFLYRKDAADPNSCDGLSPVSHREDTIVSHTIFKGGHILILDPNAVTWHLRCNTGGIRSFSDPGLWQHDDGILAEKFKIWGVTPKKYVQMVANKGKGDAIVLRSAIIDAQSKMPDTHFLVFSNFPAKFYESPGMDMSRLEVAGVDYALGDLANQCDVYQFMLNNQWRKDLLSAYKSLYNLPS